MAWLVHPGELENEVCQSAEKHNDAEEHSELVFSSSPEGCHDEDDDSNRDSSDRHPFLSVCDVVDNHEELYGEAQEEEEIEF